MNSVDFIIDYESKSLTEDEIIEGFQQMIDSGLAFQLQGHYQRTARALIDAGLCTLPSKETV